MIITFLTSLFIQFSFSQIKISCSQLFPIEKTEIVNGHPLNVIQTKTMFYTGDENGFFISGRLTKNGELFIESYIEDLSAKTQSHLTFDPDSLYQKMIQHFGTNNIVSIHGTWFQDKNLEMYLSRVAESPLEAAFSTWEGSMAVRFGYNSVKSIVLNPTSKNDLVVTVVFTK